VRRARFP